MIAVIQRVTKASVSIGNTLFSSIGKGYVVLLGMYKSDSERDLQILFEKIVSLRINGDKDGKMNLTLQDVDGELLIVSQFTLCADIKKGRRPSFLNAMEPGPAKKMYEQFVTLCQKTGIPTKTGQFGAVMQVDLINDGPVTIIVDTKELR